MYVCVCSVYDSTVCICVCSVLAEKGDKPKKKRQPSVQFSVDFSEPPDETLLTKGKVNNFNLFSIC